ncbi:unnamed protein product [Trifolium pratense]|uniref:Uncharacterized protein n=1 Tax=Trifolium pratense TaxID=57577 RepID=A0ACB0KAY6_TRIPR|nr:unnamed protein product [Trifolium pratense]
MKIKHFTFLCLCALLFISIVAIKSSEDEKQFGEIEESKTNIGINYNVFWLVYGGNKNNGATRGNVIPFPINKKRNGCGNVIPFPGCGGRGGNVVDFPGGRKGGGGGKK